MATDAAAQIDAYIAGLPAWQGLLATRLRELIHEAEPGIVEEWKWSTPVFAHRGQVCAIGVFKDHVKVNFFKGASLADPWGLLNAGLEAKASRGIDLHQGDAIDEAGLRELVRSAVDRNR
jgi:hypothetical protein